MKAMRLIIIIFCLLTIIAACAAGFEDEFRNPPEWTRPWCYWFFLDGTLPGLLGPVQLATVSKKVFQK